jgi:hypothetical protein
MSEPSRSVRQALFARSRNECAYPGCAVELTPETGDGDVTVLGEVAHIVARNRQGPRGRSELGETERNQLDNVILLCPKCHKKVDNDPRTFTVPVLKELKRQHESGSPAAIDPVGQGQRGTSYEEEGLTVSVLPLVRLPSAVYRAPTELRTRHQVIASLPRESLRCAGSFLLREGFLYAFDDLARNDSGNPFRECVRPALTERKLARRMLGDPDQRRYYVELLNRALDLFLTRDMCLTRATTGSKKRYFFAAPGGETRKVPARGKSGRRQNREVAWWWTHKRSGRSEMRHVAAAFEWLQFDDDSWGLAVEPGRYVTEDGWNARSDRIGRTVTRMMRTIHNDRYYNEFHFWVSYLASEQPRFSIPCADQRIVVAGSPLSVAVRWPGFDDEKFDPAAEPDRTLLTPTIDDENDEAQTDLEGSESDESVLADDGDTLPEGTEW